MKIFKNKEKLDKQESIFLKIFGSKKIIDLYTFLFFISLLIGCLMMSDVAVVSFIAAFCVLAIYLFLFIYFIYKIIIFKKRR